MSRPFVASNVQPGKDCLDHSTSTPSGPSAATAFRLHTTEPGVRSQGSDRGEVERYTITLEKLDTTSNVASLHAPG